MEGTAPTQDQREQRVIATEILIGQLRATQIDDLRDLDHGQVAIRDGSKNLPEWLAARADIGLETARSVVRTMRRLQDHPHVESALQVGKITFDRAEALSRLPDDDGLHPAKDVGSVRKLASIKARVDETSEANLRRPLSGCPAVAGRIVVEDMGRSGRPCRCSLRQALNDKADQFPEVEGKNMNQARKRATALVELAVGGEVEPAHVTVFVDAVDSAPIDARAGVVLEAGPKVGRKALEAIMCGSTTEVIALTKNRTPLSYGRARRGAPPALRRAIFRGDLGMCAADGCDSRSPGMRAALPTLRISSPSAGSIITR